MLRLKPTNIFDFYAPTGGLSKIADFSMRQKKVITNLTSTPANRNYIGTYIPPNRLSSPSTPSNSNSNNHGIHVLAGIVIVVVVLHYLCESINEDDNET